MKLLSDSYTGIAQSTNLLANWLIVTGDENVIKFLVLQSFCIVIVSLKLKEGQCHIVLLLFLGHSWLKTKLGT